MATIKGKETEEEKAQRMDKLKEVSAKRRDKETKEEADKRRLAMAKKNRMKQMHTQQKNWKRKE